MTAYNSALEPESQRRRSVGKFDGAAGVRVVIGHGTEKGSGLDSGVSWSIVDFVRGGTIHSV